MAQQTGLYPVNIRWGENFDKLLVLNDATRLIAKSHSLFNGAEQEIKLSDTVYGAPFYTRAKLRERVFSITVFIKAERSSNIFTRLHTYLTKAFYSGPVRVYVWRTGIGYLWLTASCEAIEEIDSHTFEIKLTAADPYFTFSSTGGRGSGFMYLPETGQHVEINQSGFGLQIETEQNDEGGLSQYLSEADEDGNLTVAFNSGNINTVSLDAGSGPDDAEEIESGIPLPYPGSAPSDPLIIYQIGARGSRWRYYRDIVVTNRSPEAISYYPVCIDLGNIAALVGDAAYPTHIDPSSGKKFFVDGPGNGTTVGYPIKDIRVETLAGARKTIWIRDRNASNGTFNDHTSVKVWTIIYSLAPGESKTLRVLYGNYRAYYSEIFPEESAVRMMFSGYASANASWTYTDFLPVQGAARAGQWSAFTEGAISNISQIRSYHPMLSNNSSELVVPAAGGRATFYGPASGAAGHQLTSPVGIESLSGTYVTSNNSKMPLYGRAYMRDGTERRIFAKPTTGEAHNTGSRNYVLGAFSQGATSIQLKVGADMSVYQNGDRIVLMQDNLSAHSPYYTIVSTIPATRFIELDRGLDAAIPDNTWVLHGRATALPAISFDTANPARRIVFFARGEGGPNNVGDWYVAGIESLTVTFKSTEYPLLTAWGSATEVDLYSPSATGYQLRGRFGNSLTGEYLYINTVTYNLLDRVQIDCKARTCVYHPWTGAGWGPPENRFEALTFLSVDERWIHLEPTADETGNNFVMYHDPSSNFTDLDVFVIYPVRYV